MDNELAAITEQSVATRPRIIAFTSGKGGVGTSVLALNTAILLAQLKKKVLLWDANFSLGSLHILLGHSARFDIRHVAAGEKRLRDIMMFGPAGVKIIPSYSGVAELAYLKEDDFQELFSQVAEVWENIDLLLMDVGAGIGQTLDLLAFADEAIVVTKPEPPALANSYALMKTVIVDQPAYPFHFLLNLVNNAGQAREVCRAMEAILFRYLGYRPGNAGFVVKDDCVSRSVVYQNPFAIAYPQALATRCLRALAENIISCPTLPEVSAKKEAFAWPAFLRRILGRRT